MPAIAGIQYLVQALLDHLHAPGELVDGDRVQVQNSFNGNHDMSKPRDDVKELLHDLVIVDRVIEGAHGVRQANDVHGEIINGPAVLEGIDSKSRRSCYALASHTRSLPRRCVLIAVHASFVIALPARMPCISGEIV